VNPTQTKPKRKFPQWIVIVIGLVIMAIAKETYRVLQIATTNNAPDDEWLPLKTIIQKKSTEIHLNDVERKKWCDCVLVKFKTKYPNGLRNLPGDSLSVTSATFAYDCLKVAVDTIK